MRSLVAAAMVVAKFVAVTLLIPRSFPYQGGRSIKNCSCAINTGRAFRTSGFCSKRSYPVTKSPLTFRKQNPLFAVHCLTNSVTGAPGST